MFLQRPVNFNQTARADLSLLWVHTSKDTFSHVVFLIIYANKNRDCIISYLKHRFMKYKNSLTI